MAKFEAHITIPREQSEKLNSLEGWKTGTNGVWKYSAFDADPIMGDKPYSYLTSYDTDQFRLLFNLGQIGKHLEAMGITVLRSKIERIIFDTKTGVDEILGRLKRLDTQT